MSVCRVTVTAATVRQRRDTTRCTATRCRCAGPTDRWSTRTPPLVRTTGTTRIVTVELTDPRSPVALGYAAYATVPSCGRSATRPTPPRTATPRQLVARAGRRRVHSRAVPVTRAPVAVRTPMVTTTVEPARTAVRAVEDSVVRVATGAGGGGGGGAGAGGLGRAARTAASGSMRPVPNSSSCPVGPRSTAVDIIVATTPARSSPGFAACTRAASAAAYGAAIEVPDPLA